MRRVGPTVFPVVKLAKVFQHLVCVQQPSLKTQDTNKLCFLPRLLAMLSLFAFSHAFCLYGFLSLPFATALACMPAAPLHTMRRNAI